MKTLQQQIRIKKISVAGMMMKPLVVLSAILVSSALCTAAWGQTSTIFTEDFEDPRTDNTDPLPTPTGWDVTRARTDIIGLFDQGVDGDQSWRASFSAWEITTTDTILDATVTEGAEYTLSFLYWAVVDNRGVNFRVRLLAIDSVGTVTILAEDDDDINRMATTKADAETFTLSVTPTTNVGERLAIQLRDNGTGRHTMIDDVLLQSYVPPPAGTVIVIK